MVPQNPLVLGLWSYLGLIPHPFGIHLWYYLGFMNPRLNIYNPKYRHESLIKVTIWGSYPFFVSNRRGVFFNPWVFFCSSVWLLCCRDVSEWTDALNIIIYIIYIYMYIIYIHIYIYVMSYIFWINSDVFRLSLTHWQWRDQVRQSFRTKKMRHLLLHAHILFGADPNLQGAAQRVFGSRVDQLNEFELGVGILLSSKTCLFSGSKITIH